MSNRILGSAQVPLQSRQRLSPVPLIAPSACLRVTARGNDDASYINDTDIRVESAAIALVLPDAATVTRTGARQTILWMHNLGAEKPVAIDVSGDGGKSWRNVAASTVTKGPIPARFVGRRPAADGTGTRAHLLPRRQRRVRGVAGVYGRGEPQER